MSTIEDIFKEAKTRCDLLRESIDRGLYDSPQPAKKIAFQEKLQQIIGDGQEQIKQYYKKKHGIKYRFKNKNAETEKKDELFQMVLGYQDDLTNRLALLNYYIKNQSHINDPKKCRDMSEEKCTRAANISDCYWVPGSDKLGEWAMRQNGKGIVINKPEYIGVGAAQKPRGCYPISKGESKKTPQRDLTNKELKILQLKGNDTVKNLTKAQIAERNINSSNTSKLTNVQLQRRRNRQSKKAKRKQEMNAMLERLKGMSKTKGGVASKMNNTRMGGGKKRKTKKRRRRKKKGGARKNAMNELPIVGSLYYITIHYPASERVRAKDVVGEYVGTGEEFYGMGKNDHLFMVKNPPASLENEEGPWLASSWKLNERKNLIGGKKTRKKRGGNKKKRMTAKQYWKSGRFSGKTWWMPRSMKTASWFHDTLKYGIPI